MWNSLIKDRRRHQIRHILPWTSKSFNQVQDESVSSSLSGVKLRLKCRIRRLTPLEILNQRTIIWSRCELGPPDRSGRWTFQFKVSEMKEHTSSLGALFLALFANWILLIQSLVAAIFALSFEGCPRKPCFIWTIFEAGTCSDISLIPFLAFILSTINQLTLKYRKNPSQSSSNPSEIRWELDFRKMLNWVWKL